MQKNPRVPTTLYFSLCDWKPTSPQVYWNTRGGRSVGVIIIITYDRSDDNFNTFSSFEEFFWKIFNLKWKTCSTWDRTGAQIVPRIPQILTHLTGPVATIINFMGTMTAEICHIQKHPWRSPLVRCSDWSSIESTRVTYIWGDKIFINVIFFSINFSKF